MSTGTFIRRSGAWVSLAKSSNPMPLPTGAGIYTYAQTGQSDVQSAYNWVSVQGGTALTFPAGTYPIVADFSTNSCPVLIPPGISTYGQGPSYTKFTITGPLTITGIPTTGTNPYYIIRTTGGGNPITMSGFSLDGSALASVAMSNFKGTYASGTTYAVGDLVVSGSINSVFRSLQASNIGHTPVGGVSDSWWEYLVFGGLMIHIENSPVLQNILVKGIYAYANIPPGEIFSINVYKPSGTATINDVEVDGGGTGGALIGCNSNNVDATYVFNRTYTHDSGHSHGIAMYQCKDATFNDCISVDNGTGTGGSGGIGFNHEETYGTTVHNRSKANHGNTLASSRFEAGDNGGVNNTNFSLNSVTFTNSLYSMKLQNLQTTIPTYDGTSILRGSKPTNVGTQTVYPLPCVYVGA